MTVYNNSLYHILDDRVETQCASNAHLHARLFGHRAGLQQSAVRRHYKQGKLAVANKAELYKSSLRFAQRTLME